MYRQGVLCLIDDSNDCSAKCIIDVIFWRISTFFEDHLANGLSGAKKSIDYCKKYIPTLRRIKRGATEISKNLLQKQRLILLIYVFQT